MKRFECFVQSQKQFLNEKSARRDAYTALAVVTRIQKFSPRRRPPSRWRRTAKIISWRWSLPLPTNLVWWRLMHAISSYRGNRHRPPDRPPAVTNPQTGPITIHCAAM